MILLQNPFLTHRLIIHRYVLMQVPYTEIITDSYVCKVYLDPPDSAVLFWEFVGPCNDVTEHLFCSLEQ